MDENKELNEVTLKTDKEAIIKSLTDDVLFYGNTEIDNHTKIAMYRNYYIMGDLIDAMERLAKQTRYRDEHSAREIREDIYKHVENLQDLLDLVMKALTGEDDVF